MQQSHRDGGGTPGRRRKAGRGQDDAGRRVLREGRPPNRRARRDRRHQLSIRREDPPRGQGHRSDVPHYERLDEAAESLASGGGAHGLPGLTMKPGGRRRPRPAADLERVQARGGKQLPNSGGVLRPVSGQSGGNSSESEVTTNRDSPYRYQISSTKELRAPDY